jgi:hypothetical protein
VLCVRAAEGLVARAPVGGRLGTHVVVGLRADQPVWAEILAGDEPVAVSRRTTLPPDGPSRLYQPLLARIAVDRPLHALPRDLRAGRAAPTASGATASERSWLRAAGGAPTRLGETEHEALVSSLVHAVVR